MDLEAHPIAYPNVQAKLPKIETPWVAWRRLPYWWLGGNMRK